MDEKIVIKSKLYNIKKIRNIIFIIGLIAVALVIMSDFAGTLDVEGGLLRLVSTDYIERHGIFDAILFLVVIPLCIMAPFVIIGQIFYMAMSKVEMTVTNKRVYGKAIFGRRVDLPLDMISAIGTTLFKGIAVTTASGAIKFQMIKNSIDIHSAISQLLVERQEIGKKASRTIVKQEIPQSNAEELRKYKELLDLGVITQEEFNAKKKQLLGL